MSEHVIFKSTLVAAVMLGVTGCSSILGGSQRASEAPVATVTEQHAATATVTVTAEAPSSQPPAIYPAGPEASSGPNVDDVQECTFAQPEGARQGEAVVVQAGLSNIWGKWYGRLVVMPEGGGEYRLVRALATDEGYSFYDDVGPSTDEVFYARPDVAERGRLALQQYDVCPMPKWTKKLPAAVQSTLQVVTLTGRVQAEGVWRASFGVGEKDSTSGLDAFFKEQAVGIFLGNGVTPEDAGYIRVR